ncbi:hypothetical protein ACLIA0_05315 [Bacillaceae bacterium W0354]
MNEIKCLNCGGRHFREGYYKIDTDVNIYSTVVTKGDYDIDTDIYYEEIIANSDLDFKVVSEKYDRNPFRRFDETKDIYNYICEDCGYIMSFTKQQNVESRKQEQERKKRENTYDWTNFGN